MSDGGAAFIGIPAAERPPETTLEVVTPDADGERDVDGAVDDRADGSRPVVCVGAAAEGPLVSEATAADAAERPPPASEASVSTAPPPPFLPRRRLLREVSVPEEGAEAAGAGDTSEAVAAAEGPPATAGAATGAAEGPPPEPDAPGVSPPAEAVWAASTRMSWYLCLSAHFWTNCDFDEDSRRQQFSASSSAPWYPGSIFGCVSPKVTLQM